MANPNAPFGLKPVRDVFSGPTSGGLSSYVALSGDSAAIYRGDPVAVTGTATADGIPVVAKATLTTDNLWTGVALGFRPRGATEWLGYRPASVEYEVLVCDDPTAEYFCQEDSDSSNLAAVDVGLNVIAAAGTASGNQSGLMIDSSSKATTATHQLRLLGLAQIPGNAIGTNAIWRVRLNTSTTTPVASTGV